MASFNCVVADDKEVVRDGDFPFIHRTVDRDSDCLEASIIMVNCVAFDCYANSSKNKVTCSWLKLPTESTLFKKRKSQADEAQPALLTSRKLVSTPIWTREGGSPGLSRC